MNRILIWIIMFVLTLGSVSAATLMEDPLSCADTKWYLPNTWYPCFSDRAIQENLIEMHGTAFEFETLLTELSIASFDAELIMPFWIKINYLAWVIFAIIVGYTGYLFLFSAIDIRKKIKAKQQVLNIFLMILFTNLSLILALLVLEFSNLLTKYLWTSMLNEQIFTESMIEIIYAVEPLMAIFYFIIFLVFGIPLMIKMISRLVILIAFLAALPLIVTFNFFLPTKHYGAYFLKLFFINAFFPIIWILVFTLGKVILGVITGDSIIVAELASVLVFASALYLNNYLYKALAFNLSIKEAVTKTIGTGVTVWKTARVILAAA